MSKFLPKSEFSLLYSVFVEIRKTRLFISVSCLMLGQGLYIALPGLLGILVDRVFVQEKWGTSWFLIFPAGWLISSVFSSLGKFFSSLILQDVRKISKKMIFQHIVSLPNRVYAIKDAGTVESLLQEASFSLRYIFGENLPFFVRTVTTLIVAMIVIWQSSVILSSLFFLWFFFYIFVSCFVARRSVKHVADSIASAAKVSASNVDVIQNHELIPAFGTENYEIERFEKILEEERKCFNKTQGRIDIFDALLKMTQMLLPFVVVIYLLTMGAVQEMTAGTVMSLFMITLVLVGQIGDFGQGVLSFLEMRERLRAALSKMPRSSGLQHHIRNVEPSSWDIQFEGLSFNYGNSPAIENIHLKIHEKEKVGIVGFSGAGKTTLLKVLRGFLDPSVGRVTLGGVEVSRIKPNCLSNGIAEVSQNIPLFHRSVRENVVYGCNNVSDEKIWNILEKAQIADHVKKLPHGLDTVVGVRGQKLSGGERARIGIARALIREARLILLDEATAAIDSESELLIQKGLKEVIQGRTVVAIAHRLSTLRMVDRIIVMDGGRIVADGSHKMLIEQNLVYKKLWDTQILM